MLILPWALPGVVEGILWTGIYDPSTGLMNGVLSSLHLASHGSVLLGDNRWLTIFLIELVQVWQITPLSTLLVLASMQLMPEELFEAAAIDGCGAWQSFWRITLPLARPGIAVAIVQALIATLNVFDQPYVLNGAATTGSSITEQTYFISFQNLDFGGGYALSLLITLITLVVSLVIVRAVYRRVELLRQRGRIARSLGLARRADLVARADLLVAEDEPGNRGQCTCPELRAPPSHAGQLRDAADAGPGTCPARSAAPR